MVSRVPQIWPLVPSCPPTLPTFFPSCYSRGRSSSPQGPCLPQVPQEVGQGTGLESGGLGLDPGSAAHWLHHLESFTWPLWCSVVICRPGPVAPAEQGSSRGKAVRSVAAESKSPRCGINNSAAAAPPPSGGLWMAVSSVHCGNQSRPIKLSGALCQRSRPCPDGNNRNQAVARACTAQAVSAAAGTQHCAGCGSMSAITEWAHSTGLLPLSPSQSLAGENMGKVPEMLLGMPLYSSRGGQASCLGSSGFGLFHPVPPPKNLARPLRSPPSTSGTVDVAAVSPIPE